MSENMKDFLLYSSSQKADSREIDLFLNRFKINMFKLTGN